MGQHEDQVQEGGAGLEQTVRPGQDPPGNITVLASSLSSFQPVLMAMDLKSEFPEKSCNFDCPYKLNIDHLRATVNLIVTHKSAFKIDPHFMSINFAN